MTPQLPRLLRIVGLASLAALLLVWLAPPEEDLVHGVAPPSPTAGGTPWPLLGKLLARTDEAEEEGAWPLFGTPAVVAPPPAAPPSMPPRTHRARAAPAAPFSVLGSLRDGARRRVFLLHGEQTLSVSAGDALPSGWRVQDIDHHSMLLRHVPSGQQQTLSLGELP